MNGQAKELIIFIIIVFITYWIIGIVQQIFPSRGVVGITLTKDDNITCNSKIININDELPASKSELLINDCIIGVNGEDVRKKSFNYTISKIKGKPGTNVTLKINRNNEEFECTMPRVKNQINWLFMFQ